MPFRYLLPLLLIMFSNVVTAQPGWRDFTMRYYYTILDKKGNEISFKKNKEYSIIVDSIRYKAPNIPNDSLKAVVPNKTMRFDHYIRINDFSLRLPQDIHDANYPLEIKIIHKKDTMYLNQTTGSGSRIFENMIFNNRKEVVKAKPDSDYTLQFIAGRYYFPVWAKALLDNLPLADGNVKVVNLNQRHFIIPKTLYDSIASPRAKFKNRSALSEKIEDRIVRNFTQGYFTVDKRVEPAKFENPALPYKEPYWDDALYPTKDKDVYFGRVRYSKDSLNESNWKYLFSVYNKRENTIRHWFPENKLHFLSSGYLYKDTFNTTIYQRVWFTEKADQTQHYIPPTECIYQSDDEGRTWQENRSVTKLFNKYDFEHIEFLDKDYALSYNRKEVKHKTRNYNIKQITYYLLKNMQVVDSLKTPDDYYEFDNYIERHNHYQFAVKDVMLLGTWNYENNPGYGKPFSQAVINRVNDGWEFKTEQKVYAPRPVIKVQKEADTVDYQNFHLINKHELLFKNGSGTLRVKNEVTKNLWNHGVVAIEKEKQIYLLDNDNGFTYISFDGGASWYIYPKALEARSDYQFLEIDDKDVISFFNPWKLYKVFYRFSQKL